MKKTVLLFLIFICLLSCEKKPKIGDCINGGIVFYLAEPGEDLDGDGTPDKGLVCAIVDQSSGIRWYNGSSVVVGASGIDIGTGFSNTTTIITNQGPIEVSYAAGIAKDFAGGGYSDWFLPSLAELGEMYNQKAIINTTALSKGGTAINNNTYWSSTEEGDDDASDTSFASGNQTTSFKGTTLAVRAIRVF